MTVRWLQSFMILHLI
uniref:Uncharacterized protein n=1 Tax=Anguilla anguilla TaxID=7936 RepID=A0A0E9S645_ANGAN